MRAHDPPTPGNDPITRWVVGVVAVLIAVTPSSLDGQMPPAEEIDAIFSEWDNPDSPGCVLGVIRDGALIYTNGYGSANLDWNVPIGATTVFYVGSVSKQFTAAAVALLAAEGDLSLDEDIRTYFPEMPAYEAPVTVRHLVHHISGIRDIYALMAFTGHRVEDVFPDEEALDLISSQTSLNFLPGDEFLYSNSGYFLMAQLVERVSGQTLREYTEEKIFGPLGMADTHFHDRPGHIVPRRAMSYDEDGAGGFVQNYLTNFDKVGQGGLYTTIEDLLRWDENFYDEAVGGPGFTERMLHRGVLNDGDTIDYAFGLRDTEYKGLPIVAHSGGMMGFRADLLRFPEQHLSVGCLCNLGTINPTALTRRVADLFLSEQIRTTYEEYEGAYQNDDFGATYRVEFEEGSLFLRPHFGGPLRLDPREPDRFAVGGFFGALAFVREQGRVAELVLDNGRARNVRFRRVGGLSTAEAVR